jgi:hypothetical protein
VAWRVDMVDLTYGLAHLYGWRVYIWIWIYAMAYSLYYMVELWRVITYGIVCGGIWYVIFGIWHGL